jgi:hypothetical protein
MCKKCLTFWTNGEFTVELKKPKHKRRLRKKFLIEKYSRQFKEEQNPKKIKTLKKILRRMNRQNNQVAVSLERRDLETLQYSNSNKPLISGLHMSAV